MLLLYVGLIDSDDFLTIEHNSGAGANSLLRDGDAWDAQTQLICAAPGVVYETVIYHLSGMMDDNAQKNLAGMISAEGMNIS